MKRSVTIIVLQILLIYSQNLFSQSFIHPGIDVTTVDLKCMKDNIIADEQPLKDAFERIKNGLKSNTAVTPFAHVQRGYYGLTITECSDMTISGNLVEANDRSGIMAEYLFAGSENITFERNRIQYNNGFGIESYATKGIKLKSNELIGNGKSAGQQKISGEKYIVMQ